MAPERPHPVSEGSMEDPVLTFDLPALLAQVRREGTWASASRAGRTLVKTQGLRVVLMALHAGATIPAHQADGPISVQMIEGTLTFRTEAHTFTLRPGQLLALQAGIPHAVEAVDEAAFLLTIATASRQPGGS